MLAELRRSADQLDNQGVDLATFAAIMGSLPTGIAIITTVDHEGRPVGLTTNAITSVSAEPPLLLICVDRSSRTLPALRHSGRFLVNFMGHQAAEHCSIFASKVEDKFSGIDWRPSADGGLPHLSRDVVAWAACDTEQEVDAGDHVILIGRVVAGEPAEPQARPLVYLRRGYGVWAPQDAVVAE